MVTKNISLTTGLDLQTEQQALDRRRKLAELIQQQAMQQDQGQTVPGGIYVPPSPVQGLSKLAQALIARNSMEDVDRSQSELLKKNQQELVSGLQDYQKLSQGTPERTVANDADANEMVTLSAVPPNRQAALARLLQSQNPTLQQVGMQQMMAKPENNFNKVDAKDYTPESVSKFSQTQNYADLVPRVKKEFVNGMAVDPYATNTGTVIPKESNPFADLVVPDGKGGFMPNAPVINAKKDIAKSGKTDVNLNVSTEKKYGEQFAGKVAESDIGMRDAALKAPDLAERANRMKEILASGKVITGTGADTRLAIGKALNLVGASDQDTIANTEALMIDMSRNTLDAIKSSGLGSGSGFSNADRDFLEKAAGGKINLEASTISKLSELAHRAAEKSAGAWNKRVKEIPASALQGTGITVEPIAVQPAYSASGAKAATGKLSDAEQKELDALRKRFGK